MLKSHLWESVTIIIMGIVTAARGIRMSMARTAMGIIIFTLMG